MQSCTQHARHTLPRLGLRQSQSQEEVRGFDEQIQVAFNDIDLCLRIREKGYLIVYTPYATLYHLESASRKDFHPMEDEEYFRKRWGSVIYAGDPYYNPHLSLEQFDFRLRILDSHYSSSVPR